MFTSILMMFGHETHTTRYIVCITYTPFCCSVVNVGSFLHIADVFYDDTIQSR